MNAGEKRGGLRTGRPAITMILALVIGAMSSIMACSPEPDVGTVIAETDQADGSFGFPVLFDDGMVFYLHYSSSGSGGPDMLGRIDASGQSTEVVLPDLVPGKCDVGAVVSLRALPDGRLGLVARCPEAESPYATTSFAFDRATGTITRLASAYGGYDVIWRPGLRDGWVEYPEVGCGSIAPLTVDSLMPVPNYSPKELLPWKLDSGFYPHATCISDGLVSWLGLAGPDGLVLLASPDAIGVDSRRSSMVATTSPGTCTHSTLTTTHYARPPTAFYGREG